MGREVGGEPGREPGLDPGREPGCEMDGGGERSRGGEREAPRDTTGIGTAAVRGGGMWIFVAWTSDYFWCIFLVREHGC